jgi:hypothetical protein
MNNPIIDFQLGFHVISIHSRTPSVSPRREATRTGVLSPFLARLASPRLSPSSKCLLGAELSTLVGSEESSGEEESQFDKILH